jgi:type III secretory pathway component EscV
MTKKKTAMFYTGELHKAKPIAIVIASMLIFWAFTVYNFPDWAFIIFAVVSGVSIALALGDRELAETTRRHKLQEELDDASRRS